jgi:UDP-glucose 4-epimerase
MSKILITGGAGFIGSHLSDKLITVGHDVVIVDNLVSGRLSYVNPKSKFYLADIRDDIIEKIFSIEKPDIVYHLAANWSVPYSVENPKYDLDVNLRGLLNLLEQAVRFNCKNFIFTSSGGTIYGDVDEYPTTEKTEPKPYAPYAITKVSSERYLNFYFQHYGLNYSVLRLGNAYGPRQMSAHESGVVTIFIKSVLNGDPVKIYTFPQQHGGMDRDYIFIDDIVNALVKAENLQKPEIINIGTGLPTNTLTILETIEKITGQKIQHSFRPPRQGDLERNCLNIDKAKEILNWTPKVSLYDGLNLTIEYFKIALGL